MVSCSTMTCHLCPGYHFKHVEFIAWITVIPSGANNLSKNWGMNQLQRAFKNKHGAYLVLQRTPYRCQTPLVSGQRTWFWVIWGLDVSDPEKAGCTTWISDDSSHPKSELNFQPLRACMLVE